MESGSLGSLRMDTRLKRVRGVGGGELSCFAHLVCAILHGIGLWDIQSQKCFPITDHVMFNTPENCFF